MHLKLSGIDGRFQEAITRTLELVEEQDRSLEYFRSGSAGYQSDVPTCELVLEILYPMIRSMLADRSLDAC